MIRDIRALDYWREAYKTEKYEYVLKELDLKGIYGFNKIIFNKGIYAICGLNGAGKSTILTCLKDILGVNLDPFETKKIGGATISLDINNDIKRYSNIEGNRLIDYIEFEQICCFADYKKAIDNMDFFLKNQNLDELLEQYDDNNLSREIVEELSYIVGKEYSKCELIEIDDEDSHPFFKVSSLGIEYDSISMGVGEHFLFYIHWLVNKIGDEKILIIEEPETFVSISSQIKLMNYLAKISTEKGISIVISTHSPYIVQNIQKQNICIINRLGADAVITYPSIHGETLSKLGMQFKKRGIIYLEDEVAEALAISLIRNIGLNYILDDYNFEIANGASEITARLKFPISKKFEFQIIGIYDGDMRESIETQKSKIHCKYLFLPIESVEKEAKKLILSETEKFAEAFKIEKDKLNIVLSEIAGIELHDWFNCLAVKLRMKKTDIVDLFCQAWILDGNNKAKLEQFKNDISRIFVYD